MALEFRCFLKCGKIHGAPAVKVVPLVDAALQSVPGKTIEMPICPTCGAPALATDGRGYRISERDREGVIKYLVESGML